MGAEVTGPADAGETGPVTLTRAQYDAVIRLIVESESLRQRVTRFTCYKHNIATAELAEVIVALAKVEALFPNEEG